MARAVAKILGEDSIEGEVDKASAVEVGEMIRAEGVGEVDEVEMVLLANRNDELIKDVTVSVELGVVDRTVAKRVSRGPMAAPPFELGVADWTVEERVSRGPIAALPFELGVADWTVEERVSTGPIAAPPFGTTI